MILQLFLISGLAFNVFGSSWQPCQRKSFGKKENNDIVCECTENYCDTLGEIATPDDGVVSVYTSTKTGQRFFRSQITFNADHSDTSSSVTTLTINRRKTFQTFLGIGGSFTDAAGINIDSLPEKMQNDIISSYYSTDGIEYNIGRVPMASTDFSTRDYSYADTPDDFELTSFQLAEEDLKYKIPYIKKAKEISSRNIRLFASPWSSPFWMKTNNNMTSNGTLKGDVGGIYYQTWAEYFVKFFKAYEEHDIEFWGVTAENEPSNGYVAQFPFQCLGFTAETQRDFIKTNLGPTLKKAGYGLNKIQLMIMDDQRYNLPAWAKTVLNDESAAQYVSGIAVHWYGNTLAPASVLDTTHNLFPTTFILPTEACEGSFPWQTKVILGSWERAESYAHDIIENLLHWSVGWVDWNLALDMEGGPNWVKNFVDAPIIVNSTEKVLYKQPMFYALGHISKFLMSGSRRMEINSQQNTTLESLAFETPDDATVVVILNKENSGTTLVLVDPDKGEVTYQVPARSIQTFIWKT